MDRRLNDQRSSDEPQRLRSERNAKFSEKIHSRARESAVELHKLLVGLSTGVLAVYFLALTSRAEPPLTVAQAVAVVVGLGGMAVALAAGVLGWYADSRRNFLWATAIVTDEPSERHALYTQRDRWVVWKERLAWVMGISFAVGVMTSSAYVVLRAFRL